MGHAVFEAASACEQTAEPSIASLQHEMANFPLPPAEQPLWHSQFGICALRYLLKRFRSRHKYYVACGVMVVAGMIVGSVSAKPRLWDIIMTNAVSNAMLCACLGSAALATFGDAAERYLCEHEDFCGVRREAEAAARMAADMVMLAPLPICFCLPFQAWTGFSGGLGALITIGLAAAWAISPLAYAATILVPANAMIITSVFTLMSCLLFAGEPPYPTGSRACRAARCARCPPDTRGFAR